MKSKKFEARKGVRCESDMEIAEGGSLQDFPNLKHYSVFRILTKIHFLKNTYTINFCKI